MTETQKQEIALNSSIQMLHHDELPPAPAAHVGCWGWPPRCWDTSAPHLLPALGTLRLRARGSLSGRNKLSWGRCSGADLHHLSCIKPSQLRGGRSQSKSFLMNLAELLGPTSSTNASKYQSTSWWEQRIAKKKQAGKIGNITKLEARLKMYHKKKMCMRRQARATRQTFSGSHLSIPSQRISSLISSPDVPQKPSKRQRRCPKGGALRAGAREKLPELKRCTSAAENLQENEKCWWHPIFARNAWKNLFMLNGNLMGS